VKRRQRGAKLGVYTRAQAIVFAHDRGFSA
jgi:hypothetical protein